MSEEESFIEQHILQRFDIEEKLGKGAYGVVWKAKEKGTDQDAIALKKIFKAFQNSTDSQRTYREVILLTQLKHENIIKLHRVIKSESGEDLYLVFEYMDSDLHYAIRSGILEDDHKRYILYQLLKALLFIHSSNVVHRDLKPENLLLNTACQLRVADFGLARSIDEKTEGDYPMTEYVATRWYRAPEIVFGSTVYTKGVDMWAVGCIIAELYIRKPLFPGKSTMDQLARIMEITGRPTEIEIEETSVGAKHTQRLLDGITKINFRSMEVTVPDGPEDAIDLVKKLLRFAPKDRLTIEQALEHEYVARFRTIGDERRSDIKVSIPIDDNTRRSIDIYRSEIYKLTEVPLNTSPKDEPDNNKEEPKEEKPTKKKKKRKRKKK